MSDTGTTKKKINPQVYETINEFNPFFEPPVDKNYFKVSLTANGKDPSSSRKWSGDVIPIKRVDFANCNVGIVTGLRNGIIGVDIDAYRMDDDNLFIIKYGKNYFKKLITKIDTLTIKTPSGGYHLYFKYDIELRQTQNKKIHIDIRNEGGYLVCPPSKINDKKYEIIINTDVKQIPEDFKKWLMDNLYETKTVQKIKTPKLIKDDFDDIDDVDTNEVLQYAVEITSQEFKDILSLLPVDCEIIDDYRGDRDKWLTVMSASKFCNMKKEFIEFSSKTIHKNYKKEKINQEYKSSYANIEAFLNILRITKTKNTYTYKSIPNNNFKDVTETFTKDKLKGTDYTLNRKTLVKSDTGTGKTTAFRKFIKKHKLPFISICSRVSLACEQHRTFSEEGIKCFFYKDKEHKHGDSFIITPESLVTIKNYDFSDYVIFLDEFDSIVNHIITSDTLKNSRTVVFALLLHIVHNCKQFIAVDADVSYVSKYLLDYMKCNYAFKINEFKNYSGVNVTTIPNQEDFFKELEKHNKFILCSDSKALAEIADLKSRLAGNDGELILFTSDSETDSIILDEYLKVICSPKLTYGLDSIMFRSVFCFLNGNTISPSQMVQQIARCRNIEHVYIYFTNITSKKASYIDYNDCVAKNNYQSIVIQNIEIERSPITHEEKEKKLEIGFSDIQLFNTLFMMNAYRNDCYNTNKYLHLMKILRDRGFNVDINHNTEHKCSFTEEREKIEEKKLENFDKDSEKVIRLNEILKIPYNNIDVYKNYFIDRYMVVTHFNVSLFFFKDNIDNLDSLLKQKDYNICKKDNTILKLDLLDKLLKSINLDKHDLHLFKPDNTDVANYKNLEDIYKKLYRNRSKNFSLKTPPNVYKEICKIYKDLFDIISSKPEQKRIKNDNDTDTDKKNDRIYIYTVDQNLLSGHHNLYNYRKPVKLIKKLF